nr:probable pectin methyltransferase QUA2 [Tanacetum cinerariifolium]
MLILVVLIVLEPGKSVWVMNVVPTSWPHHLPLILDTWFLGMLHDWCEPFPTYPRTYDLVHAEGLLSLETAKQLRCNMLDVFFEAIIARRGLHLCGYKEWCRSYKGELLFEISMKLGLAHGHKSATML